MQRIEVSDWESFQGEIKKVQDELGPSGSVLLFRGVGDSDFELSTTLERAGCERMSFSEYYRLSVGSIGPAVRSFTEFDVPKFDVTLDEAFQKDSSHYGGLLLDPDFPKADLYRYMINLRHHGFPSPLLDWSRSPYVAAFFAFRDPLGKAAKRSIYAYCEMPEGGKSVQRLGPTIRHMGPYIHSHPRHFRQQSDYTICGVFESDGWHFHSHEKVFALSTPRQDELWKFNLPSAERTRVLRALDEYNLNAFSLFDSKETLLEMMWFREHVLENWNFKEGRVEGVARRGK